jgi:hypothetical protein
MILFLVILVAVAIICALISLAIDRILIPWQAQRVVEKILHDVKEGKPQKPRNYENEIKYGPSGIHIVSLKQAKEESRTLEWSKIKRITAFKRDLYTVDCICLLFESAERPELEANEDMKGWSNLLEALPSLLPGCKPLHDWIFTVTTPAFTTNPTVIFGEASLQP